MPYWIWPRGERHTGDDERRAGDDEGLTGRGSSQG